MSFALRLKAHFAPAKAQHFGEQAALQAKAERLAEVVGNKQPPVTYADLSDGFERAIKNGMPREEAQRLRTILSNKSVKWEQAANDKDYYLSEIRTWATELKKFADELESRGARTYIKRLIPYELREKLTKEQIDTVVDELRRYAHEVCTFILVAVHKAGLGSETPAARTVGLAQVAATVEAFLGMEKKLAEPLNTFKVEG